MSKSVLSVLDLEHNRTLTIDLADAKMIVLDKTIIRIRLAEPALPSSAACITMFFPDLAAAVAGHEQIITRYAYPNDDELTRTVIKVSSFDICRN